MSTLQRLGGGLASALRLSSRQFAAGSQGAAFHASSAAEARRRKEESESSDDEQQQTPSYGGQQQAQAQRESDALEWPPALDPSDLRNLDGSVAQEPVAKLVAHNNGRWDINTLISPALAAALEAAPASSRDEADASFQKLHDALTALDKGKSLPGDEPATDDDLRRVAEAIELYFQAAPEADPEMDGLEEEERDMLDALRDTICEVLDGGARSQVVNMAPPGRIPWEVLDADDEMPMVNWAADLTEGKAVDPWKNALLSEEAKQEMWAMHKQGGWSAEALAEHFGIRQQRALAILALKEREAAARKAGEPLQEELSAAMEEAFEAHEARGSGERHHVVLPSFPNYRELTEDDAEKLAAMLEAQLGKPFDDITPEDMTADVTQKLLAAAGMDKGALEEQLAQREEEALVAEFKRALEYNIGQTGTTLSRSSRKKHAPQRPAAGWGLLVQPLGKAARAAAAQPFVALPDGSKRELTADEKLQLERQQPRPRHKIL